jgi:hypothetical protein
MPRHNPAATSGTVVLEAPSAAPAASSTPASSPKPQASGLKKVSFGKIAKKAETTKTAYPVFPDEQGKASEIAARILERTEQFEALKGALETDKAELKFLVTPHYFAVNHGRHEVPSSISVAAPQGAEVLVTFQNRYSMLTDESALLPILGGQCGTHFRQSFELKIKGDKLPADKTQDLMDRLQSLFAEFGATDALEVKEGIKPVEQFHAARHVALTPEQNLALEQVCPIVAMVKTKGRR